MAKTKQATPDKPAKRPRQVWLARPFVALGHYVRDSWRELRQVEWPDRRETWQLTVAVIGFSLFIGVLVAACDIASQWIIRRLI